MDGSIVNDATHQTNIKQMRKTRRIERKIRSVKNYAAGTYWQDRMDMMYYHYVDYILRTLGRDATSMIDVGTANCPYQEKFDWIPERVSFDQAPPYSSENIAGIQGDFLSYDFGRKFDVATCLQVLEHVPKARTFMRKLLKISDLVIVSVPYKWPESMIGDHVQDPVTYEKLVFWAGRKPNYSIIVEEPFRSRKRMIAVFDADKQATYGKKDFKQRINPGASIL